MLSRRPRLNGVDVNANRLFSLFAQNRRHRNAQSVDHPGANNSHSSLKLDWDAFCSDLFSASEPAHVSSWQRLSQQITKLHRSQFVPTSKPLFDSKFKWSFNVAMSLTVRALTLKGVSPAIIAMTQTSLCQQHLQRPKPDLRGLSVAASMPSSKQIRDSVLPMRRSASFPILPRRSQQARDCPLAKPLAASTFMLSSKRSRRNTVAPLHSKSLPHLFQS